MNSADPVWYLPGKEKKPIGPYTADQIVKRLQTSQIDKSTLCWREGMPKWLPLERVEPFAAIIQMPESPPAKPRNVRRIVAAVIATACLAGIGGAGFVYWREASTMRTARRMIAENDFTDASRLLEPFAKRSYLHGDEARYLLAVALAKQYASASDGEDSFGPDRFQQLESLLKAALDANQRWRESAQSDLADLIGHVPPDAPDAMARIAEIATFLNEHELTDKRQLAKELCDKLKAVRSRTGQTAQPLVDAAIVRQILHNDPSLAGELLTEVLPDPHAPAGELDRRLILIERWAQETPGLAEPLAAGLLQLAPQRATPDNHRPVEAMITAAEKIDPKRKEECAQAYLQYLKTCLAAGGAAGVVRELDRTVGQRPAVRSAAPALYLEAARSLSETDVDTALAALQQAVRIDPSAADSAENTLLWIRLNPQPSEEKLRRCQDLLGRLGDDPRRRDVLVGIVSDAVTAADKYGRWQQAKAEPHLAAAQAAAEELLKKFPEAPKLDTTVFALAQRLANAEKVDQAQHLAVLLKNALPDTSLKLEIGQKIAQWRQKQGRGTLPADLDDLEDRVEKELKIMNLSSPGAVRVLQENPRAIHVVQVACTADKFNSEEADLFRQWVAGGGIVWATNDVLSLFKISYAGNYCPSKVRHQPCKPSVSPEVCPILTGCSQVRLSWSGWWATHLSAETVLPLLALDGITYWSMVPYGQGWIIDTKTVDTSSYDGARFWLNFRLFCLGWEIAGASRQGIDRTGIASGSPGGERRSGVRLQPTSPLSKPTIITSGNELEKALAELDQQRVIWAQLTKEAVSDDQLKKLQDWVNQGGVLWLDTDLGREFGFRLVKAPGNQLRGTAKVSEAGHPVLENVKAGDDVKFVLSPTGLLISGTWGELTRTMTPLLGWNASRTRLFSPCAVRNVGRGIVVYRPREFDTDSDAGQQIARNLTSWSFKVAPSPKARPKPEADAPTEEKP